MALHAQVRISWDDWEAEVDEDIAEFILECWKNDLETITSCQDWVPDEPGEARRVFVHFPGPIAEEFLSIVAGAYDSDMDSLCSATQAACPTPTV